MKNTGEVNLGSFGRWRRLLPLSVFLLGMLSAVVVLLVALVNDERQRSYFVLADTMSNIQMEAATAHLWLEEALTAEPSHVDIREAWHNFDEAIADNEAMLTGGEVRHGRILSPLDDLKLRTQAETVKTLLAELKALAIKRYHRRATAEDKEYNALFRELMKKADRLHASIIGSQGRSYIFWRQIFWGVLLVWTIIVNIASVALWSREEPRYKTEDAPKAE